MPFSSYSAIKTGVASWLNRADLESSIPDFISLGEERIARELRIPPLIAIATIAVPPSGNTGPLPNRFIEFVEVILSGSEVHYVPENHINRVSGAESPWAYSIVGTNIQVAPNWTAGGDLSTKFYQKQPPLSDSSPTNWFTANAPDVVIYAALLESAPKLRDSARIAEWKGYYDAAVAALNSRYRAIN